MPWYLYVQKKIMFHSIIFLNLKCSDCKVAIPDFLQVEKLAEQKEPMSLLWQDSLEITSV